MTLLARTGGRGLLGAALLASALGAHADTELEQLGALARELELVRALVERAERTPAESRVVFDYDAVSRALAELEFGVRAHISLVHSQPRAHWNLSNGEQGSGIDEVLEP